MYKSFKKTHNATYKTKYKDLRSQVKDAIKIDFSNFTINTENNISNNIKSFWKYVDSKKSTSTGIPDTMQYNNISSSAGNKIANMFADYFKSVYSDSNTVMANDDIDETNHTSINTITITQNTVFDKLSSLDSNKSAGPDGIPSYFIKMCSPTLATPLYLLFNTSLKSGTVPDTWKVSFITPLHKTGDRCRVENYRPISGLNIFSKILESIITDSMSERFRNIICVEQHGFTKNRSTATNLTVYSEYISQALSRGEQVDVVYTDFQKAFDRVNHNILLQKLHCYGICGDLLEWFKSYLCNRFQIVKVNNYKSYKIYVTSGVPQGSHLGPFLFLLFINDIVNGFSNCKVLLFADDLKLYSVVNDKYDAMRIQVDINSLEYWCAKNNMHLNANKCKIMTFTRKRKTLCFGYTWNNIKLEAVSYIKDLGVTFDREMNFKIHYDNITRKSLKMCGFVIRMCKDFSNINTCILLYNSLVRSNLEYCSIIWSPHFLCHINRLENVQKKFINFLLYKLKIDKNLYIYEQRLLVLGFDSLLSRRNFTALLFMYKLINGLIDASHILELILIKIPTYFSRAKETFYIDFNNTEYGKNSILNRLLHLTNGVGDHIDIFAVSLEKFKASRRALTAIV